MEVDSRGRNVWRWARNLAESTSVLLKRLERTDLELEATRQVKARIGEVRSAAGSRQPTARAPADSELALDGGGDSGGGFDPYNKR